MDNPIVLRMISALGIPVLLALAWLCSENRRQVDWRLVAWGVALQFVFGLLVLRSAAGEGFLLGVKSGFDLISEASLEGAQFVFGNLTEFFFVERYQFTENGELTPAGPYPISALIAFRVLPVIVFVSALSAMLQHIGIVQAVVRAMAWAMRRTLRTSGAETFGTALLVFLGIESMSAIRDYLKSMTRSEMFTLMTAFLSTIAASVMVAYANFGAAPGHLLAASIMSAPAAIAIAKILVPETGAPDTRGHVRIAIPRERRNLFDAAANGAHLGLNMALSVAALLIAFVGLLYLFDQATIAIAGMPLTGVLGYAFRPFAFVMGVPPADIAAVSELLATKTVFNEFLAYQAFSPLVTEGALSPRAQLIATYALCGFANPGSLGIMIGGLAGIVPERRSEVAALSLRALLGGTLACFTTACVAGLLSNA